ncbi:MAG: type II toxin-antitoxin system mRNA interferase toxin, RelE/StbE family [Candidatus Marinimicrobia bacterium]|nr:type II toxin-antitoxin system mRNA interferase toxin, RelE/StbE family [Candidatus Neomarinimicrobiota bacterium]
MKTLVWSKTFLRAFKQAIRRQPELEVRVKHSLQQLAEDPFHPSLHSHKLKGSLKGSWACTVDYDNRILFELVKNPESGEDDILLLTMGTHDEVY